MRMNKLNKFEPTVGLWASGDLLLNLNLYDLPLLKGLEGGLGLKETDLPPSPPCGEGIPQKG